MANYVTKDDDCTIAVWEGVKGVDLSEEGVGVWVHCDPAIKPARDSYRNGDIIPPELARAARTDRPVRFGFVIYKPKRKDRRKKGYRHETDGEESKNLTDAED